MKKATTCIVCFSPVRESFGYKLSYKRKYESPITGEIVKEELSGLVCPVCNQKLGYKTSKKKMKKFKGEQGDGHYL